MPDIKDIVDRVAHALGSDADPARVEAVVSSLLDGEEPASVLSGARLRISLSDCSSLLANTVRSRGYDKIRRIASHMESAVRGAGLGGALHIATSPLTRIAGRATASEIVVLARMLDDVARDCAVSEISGLTACAEHGIGSVDAALLSAIHQALHETSRAVVDVRAASPAAGVNLDAVLKVVAALRRLNVASDDILRLRLSSTCTDITGRPASPHAPDADLYLTADASVLIDSVLQAAPDANIQDVAHLLTATAHALGRDAAQQGDAAAAVLMARSGLDVRFGGIEVGLRPGLQQDDILHRAFAEAIANGFRSALRSADVLPLRVAIAFAASTTDGAAAAFLAARLDTAARSGVAVHALFSDRHAGDLLSVGPYNDLRVQEPMEPDWVRRGGQIPGALSSRP